jgi:uncharacterized protein YjeT (DUF2065 family)
MTNRVQDRLNLLFLRMVGVGLVIFGVLVSIQRSHYDAKFNHVFDFGVHHRLVGLGIALVGLIVVVMLRRPRTLDSR